MKATGIIRRLDDLGRVVIPKEIRRGMGIRENDPIEMGVGADGELIMKPYLPNASSQLRAIAENLDRIGASPEHWDIAEELKGIVKKLEKLEKREEE